MFQNSKELCADGRTERVRGMSVGMLIGTLFGVFSLWIAVTFNNQVTVLGDGSKDPCLLDSDLLSDFDSLVEKGEDLAETMLSQPVSSTAANLSDRVFSLQSDGQ